MYSVALLIHLLSLIVWLGGMAFTLFFLRPAVQQLEVPARLGLMAEVLQRFLNAVGVAVLLILASGFFMFFMVGSRAVPIAWHIMAGMGVLMALIYGHIRFAPFKRLQRAVAAQDWPSAGQALGSVRKLVGLNLLLGVLIVVVVALLGRA